MYEHGNNTLNLSPRNELRSLQNSTPATTQSTVPATRVEPVLSIDYQPGTQSNVEQNTEVPRASFSRLESLAMSNRPPSRRPARQPRPRAPRPEAPPISAPPPKGVKWKAGSFELENQRGPELGKKYKYEISR